MTGHDTTEPLELIRELADRLSKAGVAYCHWKSNEAIARSLTGDNDLDLLIGRESMARFRTVAGELGLVPARSLSNPRIDGIEDLIGWDRESGRFVHIQPHFRLVLGDDMTKSFHLPVEGAYLRSVGAHDVLPVPAPELEYVVFVIRMVLKHCPIEALAARKGRLTRTERAELDQLERAVDPAEIERLRAELFPMVPAATWELCRRGIEPEAGLTTRARAGRTLTSALRTLSQRPLLVDTALKLWRRRTYRPSSPKRPATLGLLVGIVGSDGSGKSTLVDRLTVTLGEVFAVERVHLGKPHRGLLRRVTGRLLRTAASEETVSGLRAPAWHEHSAHPGLAYVLWHLLIARDRRRAYVAARRSAGRGNLVVCDRFPLGIISNMDGARTTGLPGGSKVARWLAEREQRIYRTLLPPDLLLVLRVAPEIAATRRPDQEDEFVRTRAAEVFSTDWNGTGAVVLDAGASPDEVFREAFAAIWSRL